MLQHSCGPQKQLVCHSPGLEITRKACWKTGNSFYSVESLIIDNMTKYDYLIVIRGYR